MAFDFKKEYKEFYMPKNKPEIVTVPKANYIAVRGKGNPNEIDGAYQQAISILYAVAYTLKMSYKTEHKIEGFFEYVVPPLEGFWWQDNVDGIDYADKAAFNWISVIRLPVRNEKYCGDLVQKKTYTPDFLSHEKKYNRGQEEFVIIKDHHEPIISRELFDEANRILDAKSLSQEGKAKHSNRYPFSGKIKCGCCGSSYVARYKTRKDGSRYKAWRCNEAAKHGSPHIDKAGNQVGCTGLSIRNEDATHIMYLVTKSLKYNRNKIINNLTAVIQSIIAMDTTGTDVLKLQEQIKKIEGKRANLIDLYMSNLINKDEFTATRASCDAEIEELQSIIESVDKQREMIEQQQQLLKEIEDAIKEIVSGVEYEDEFYKHILDKMVVQDKDNIDVYLNLLPMKWSYTVAKASKKAVASEWNISEASLPISVKRPLSSGYGML